MAQEKVFPNHADVLLVTVTEVEGRAVLAEFESQRSKGFIQGDINPNQIYVSNKTYFDLGTIKGAKIFMVRSEMGAGGPAGSQATVTEAIQALSPSAVIMLGISFGVDEQKQKIGDILVSRQLELYEHQRVGIDSAGELKIIPRGDRPSASPRLLDRFGASQLRWPESEAKVQFGLILSGHKLVDNQDYREQLRSFAPEVIGGEMEGEGLYSAAHGAKVDWIVVKAICDWADGKKYEKKAERQKEAAKNAARFVIHTLMQGGFTENSNMLQKQPGRPISGKAKIEICDHVGDSWKKLADYFQIPPSEQAQFSKGDEARGIWAWLEYRKRLQELPEALGYIDRQDLINVLDQKPCRYE